MKTLFLAAVFALLLLVPTSPVVAQTDDVGRTTAKNQQPNGMIAEPSTAVANAAPEVEAQQFYDAGVTLYKAGKLPEAIDALKRSNKLKPNDPQTQYMLGMAYWKSKNYFESIDAFKRAIKVKPEWDEPYFRLGLDYYVLGRTSQVNQTYKELMALNPSLAAKLWRIVEPKSSSDNANTTPAAVDAKPITNVAIPSVTSAPANEKPSAPVDTKPITNVAIPSLTSATANEKPSAPADAKPITDVAIPSVTSAPANEKPSASSVDANVSAAASPKEPATTSSNVKANAAEANASISSPATAAQPEPSTTAPIKPAEDLPPTEIYRVGVGDILDIRFLNSPVTHSTLYSVVDGGLIDLPIAGGAIAVSGLTANEIQARVSSQLKRLAVSDQTQVSVGVRQYGSHTVVVTGLAGSPGTKILRREAVPLYVLLAEIQPRLDAARAVVLRAGSSPQILDLNDSAALNFTVKPGDVINLTARQPDFYYIAGKNISFPGQKSFQSGITLVQAILAAGGLARDGAVELSREGTDGRLTTTKLNLKEIKSGKIQDPKLQPGDRIELLK